MFCLGRSSCVPLTLHQRALAGLRSSDPPAIRTGSEAQSFCDADNRRGSPNVPIELLRAEYTKREQVIEDINTVYSEIRYMVQTHMTDPK